MNELSERGLSLWLADDDPDDQYLLAKAAKEVDPDINLVYFEQGQALLDELVCSDAPDLIILDLNMPKLTGMETLHLIKHDQNLKGVPVVIYSTSDSQEDIRDAYKAGANTFFVKPESYSGLLKMVEDICSYWMNQTCRRYPGKEA